MQALAQQLTTLLRKPLRQVGRHRSSKDDFSLIVPFDFDASPYNKTFRIAVVCHIFYPELAGELLDAISNLPGHADIFISSDTEEKLQVCKESFGAWRRGAVEYRLIQNIGRDIFPKITILRDIFGHFDLALFLHTKKSPHMGEPGDVWRKHLIGSLVGSPAVADSIIAMFCKLEDLGLVFPQHQAGLRRWMGWESCFPQARDLARKMGFTIHPKGKYEFPAGSMFWARPEALRSLLIPNLAAVDFGEEKGQVSGTLAHVIERLFCHTTEAAGFIWLKVSPDHIIESEKTAVRLKCMDDIYSYVKDHICNLLPSPMRRPFG